MKRYILIPLAIGILLALLLPAYAGEAEAADATEKAEAKVEPAGKLVFVENKCSMCHTAFAAGIGEPPAEDEEVDEDAAPDLSLVGANRTAEWLHTFLVEKKEIDGEKHMLAFKGEDKEWAALSEWLLSLGKPDESAKDAPAADDAEAPAEGSE